MQITPIIEKFFAPFINENASEREVLELLRENIILEKGARYFDWTASGLGFGLIEKRINEILPFYANTHSFFATHAKLTSALYEEARAKLSASLGLDSEFALIACGSGASGAIKKFQELLGLYIPPKTLEILQNSGLLRNLSAQEKAKLAKVFISSYEHHSNELSLREGLCEIEKIGLDSNGRFNLEDLAKKLQTLNTESSVRVIGAFCLASNVSGICTPFKEIAKLFRESAPNAPLAFDTASSSPYFNIPKECFDALFLAPHKLLGGIGACGVLALRKNFLDSAKPSFSGGGVVEYVSDKGHMYINDATHREEAGTPPILGLLRASLAYQLRNEVGFAFIARRKKVLTQILLNELKSIPALSLYGDWKSAHASENLGIISFNVACVSPTSLSRILSEKFGIQTRAGCSCAGSYGHYLMDLEHLVCEKDADSQFELLNDLYRNPQKRPGWVRVSLHYTHTLEDIEYLVDSLHTSIKILRTQG
ncbi:aminotransferase class V-fold PLP-dependent enzyme [Helicobacter himalayensis]|uniref:aminotransferase class V-fold PLP-dependent enzyme n=1 Tax=Helicobacter himalayensis TaxID=1591088 RepID=UPI003D6EF512